MSAPYGWRSPLACLGSPPEHRDHRLKPLDELFGIEISGSALIEAFVTVDAGYFRSTTIGERTWIMKKAHVGHDCIVGDDCEVAPLVSLGGETIVGDRVKIGQGAVTVPQVTIGDDARIGAGAVVTKDVPAGETWVGNPAEEITAATRRRRARQLLELPAEAFGDGCELLDDRPLSLPVAGNGLSELEQRQRAARARGGFLSET